MGWAPESASPSSIAFDGNSCGQNEWRPGMQCIAEAAETRV